MPSKGREKSMSLNKVARAVFQKATFLFIGCLLAACCSYNLPSDQKSINNFEQNKARFEELFELVQTYDSVDVLNEIDKIPKATLDSVEELYDELDLIEDGYFPSVNRGGYSRSYIWDWSLGWYFPARLGAASACLAPTYYSKGYSYLPTPPAERLLFEGLGKKVGYRHLEGNWYIYSYVRKDNLQ